MTGDNPKAQNSPRIEILVDGPYRVEGEPPLVEKSQVVSEYGEPLTWKKDGEIETSGTYYLCRCGRSGNKPFCDGTHNKWDFDGTETADTGTTAGRQVIYEGGQGIVVKRDKSLCMDSGFCGNRLTSIRRMMAQSGDPQVRAQIMAMIERCPSGSYSYSLEPDGEDVEPDFPAQVAVSTEITSEGPIAGPLWVTGNIPVVRSDGKPMETRNRVTLCNCGKSENKPLCDGTHRKFPNPPHKRSK